MNRIAPEMTPVSYPNKLPPRAATAAARTSKRDIPINFQHRRPMNAVRPARPPLNVVAHRSCIGHRRWVDGPPFLSRTGEHDSRLSCVQATTIVLVQVLMKPFVYQGKTALIT